VARVQDTDKFVYKRLGCHSRGASVNDATRSGHTFAVLRWLCFCLACSTVLQAFHTKFLIDSGYKRPVRNLDELFDSCIKLPYPPEYSAFVKFSDEKETSRIRKILWFVHRFMLVWTG